MSGLKKSNVINAIKVVLADYQKDKRNFMIVPDYDVDNFSKKVTRIVFSYIDYINRTVWNK